MWRWSAINFAGLLCRAINIRRRRRANFEMYVGLQSARGIVVNNIRAASDKQFSRRRRQANFEVYVAL